MPENITQSSLQVVLGRHTKKIDGHTSHHGWVTAIDVGQVGYRREFNLYLYATMIHCHRNTDRSSINHILKCRYI